MPATRPGTAHRATNQPNNQPWVEIIEQPSSKSTRFGHENQQGGVLSGVNSTKEKRTHPAIKVHNHNGACAVAISLVTHDDGDKPKPHPHTLVGPGCRQGVYTMVVEQNLDCIQFPNLGIQCKKEDALTLQQPIRIDPFKTGFDHMEKPQLNDINLMVVKLCFQVLLPDETGRYRRPLPAVCSEPIQDKQSAGELSIHSHLPETCPVAGREEMILLTRKLPKANVVAVCHLEEGGKRKRKSPREWMSLQSREPSWYDKVVCKCADDDAIWLENFRLTKAVIDELCLLLKDDMAPSDLAVREPISLRKRICIAIYKLASSADYRSVSIAFGVGTTSVHRCLRRFCEEMCKRKTNYIKWYTDDDAATIADETRDKYGYPQCIGAIDGSHIAITPPLDCKADYLCLKGYPSIVLQAVVDGRYTFRDVDASTPGSAHDASVFHRSPLSRFIYNNMPKRDLQLNGVTIPLHIIGDSAYPLSSCIMKEYDGRTLTEQRDSFNVYLSSVRMCVEIAFEKLKLRFKIVRKTIEAHYTFAPKIITTCCILHNICEARSLPMPRLLEDENDTELPQPEGFHNKKVRDSTAADNREVICQYLAQNFPLCKSFHL